MIRIHNRYIFGTLFMIFIISLLWIINEPSKNELADISVKRPIAKAEGSFGKDGYKDIPCIVDGEKTYQCVQNTNSGDVYFPFNGFLKKHYDLSGKILKDPHRHEERFEWTTSHAKVRFPNFSEYSFRDSFGHFASYSVETRERVRCISAQYGVPMSTQWSSVPYFYPTQIAQFALQHYSRYTNAPRQKIFEQGRINEDWTIEMKRKKLASSELNVRTNESLFEIDATERPVSVSLIDDSTASVVSFHWKSGVNGLFHIDVLLVTRGQPVRINYVHSEDNRCVWSEVVHRETQFFYSLGADPKKDEWRWICRDLLVDVGRALATVHSKKNSVQLHPGDVTPIRIVFGRSTFRQLKQSNFAHLEHFLVAASWFVNNQDESGGWPIPVERSIADKKLLLPAGWYSAMAQGHALSVLTRGYAMTNDMKYLRAAKLALRLFKIPAAKGGVLNNLFGYSWFEEYPTTPGTYVLNGFMYSLIGLFDLAQLNGYYNDAETDDSASLFTKGIESLRIFLSFYDTGIGSLYDLRHFGLKGAPNVARWDYHSLHIYLLKWLSIITKDEYFNTTADRWAAYAVGKRAKHN